MIEVSQEAADMVARYLGPRAGQTAVRVILEGGG